MCQQCVIELMPQRGSWVTDSGCYVVNLKACHGCGQRLHLSEVQERARTCVEEEEEDEYEEDISFQHTCSHCGHILGTHHYVFRVDQHVQETFMDCGVCGQASCEQSTLPLEAESTLFHDLRAFNELLSTRSYLNGTRASALDFSTRLAILGEDFSGLVHVQRWMTHISALAVENEKSDLTKMAVASFGKIQAVGVGECEEGEGSGNESDWD